MNILRIADIPNNRTGGMSRVMHGTGDALAARGHQVEYVFEDILGPSRFPKLRRFTLPWRIARMIKEKIKSGIHYDVVEIHELFACGYAFCRKFNSRLPPLVVMSYGCEARSRRTTLEYRRIKHLPISLKQRYSSYFSVVLPAMFALRNADQVLCPNSQDVSYLSAHGVLPGRITRYQSGIDPVFLEAGKGHVMSPENNSQVLFFGTWTIRKGILDLIAAVNEVFPRHPAATLTVAGCGCDASTVLREFPEPLRTRIAVIPKLSADAEVIDVYRRHGIFILPSYFEGQPLAMIEAAALELAILTTNVCGMHDFLSNNQTGIMLHPGDAPGFAAALDRLLAHPENARRLGKNARQRAADFTWDRAADLVERAYRLAMGEP